MTVTDWLAHVSRNTAWNAIVEMPNVENARPLFHRQEPQQQSTETVPTAITEAAPSERITAMLTASSSSDKLAKLNLQPDTSSSSTALQGGQGERKSDTGTSSGSSGDISKARAPSEGVGPQRRVHAGGHGRLPAELCPSGPPLRGRTWLKHQVAGHDMLASLAWNEEYLDSAAAYCRVPLSSSLDVASQDRQDGIQYRVGVHHVSPHFTI